MHSLRFQRRGEVALKQKQQQQKKKKEKESGDGRNKYLKKRLPAQLHRAEMWKRLSKQARSLGWFRDGGREREREKEREREH